MVKRGRVDITKADHVTMFVDASVKENRSCVAISVSNIRQTFVFPAEFTDTLEAEFEGIARAIELLFHFKNWGKLELVKIYSDNQDAVNWANEKKEPINSLLKSLAVRAPNLVVKFQKIHRGNNILQDIAAETWMKTMQNRHNCELCGREEVALSYHHCIPLDMGKLWRSLKMAGRRKIRLCFACHAQLHELFSNDELARFGSFQEIKIHPAVKKYLEWKKQHGAFSCKILPKEAIVEPSRP